MELYGERVTVIKKLLSGNEAIARGAYEAGVRAATAYPGTPSTEILENIAQYDEIYSEWAPNEKVAVEVAQGACFAGARSLVAMKHVGVNVAADPLFSLSYTGVNGGFIVVSADDPGMHSSQNEQDNRYYAKFMKMVLLEPSDSQEAKDFVLAGLEISEQFDIPVFLRTTTRIAHSKGLVTLGERAAAPMRPYEKNMAKYVVVPANARRLRLSLEQRLHKLARFAETFPGNRIEGSGKEFAVITSGISYQYTKEALGEKATILKLGMTFPLPENLIKNFIARFERVYVIEEGEPYLEEQIKAMGLRVVGKELLPRIGEMSTAVIKQVLLQEEAVLTEPLPEMPARPPVLCPGCPHRGVFYVINKLGAVVTTDIGCYTLGALPPLNSGETSICMGSSIGNAMGMSKMLPDKKIVATIGDSTFLHSGVTGLMDVVYNRGILTLVILDNAITGMTGHQHHPGTGFTVKNQPTNKIDLEAVVRACGVKKVWTVNAYNLTEVEAALTEAVHSGEPAVVITRQPCVLIEKNKKRLPYSIDKNCKYCKMCLRLGCPAIENKADAVVINPALCNGCGVCGQICKFQAIGKEAQS
ncbi:pyruvate flavodoxin/ferredoxin oxidoreductase thiamine dip-bdg [Lucifera butyrica]|uniref:Indolepyruvate oxidoreductase subunit IorA n=1 Tax=Lucifera butyrica TaxID=1351585 RepID=A0A498RCG6_9FIRM|nr:indolepyruvate ferredoxin oxidoreductase subunit alpha [Lucifera butyrica]VBB07912.1 pyruvate flavodoxin/ferredoxin oxidoreductase thiamine dip-bdg [Lucifera butyrica]